jgi:hypothetical protein
MILHEEAPPATRPAGLFRLSLLDRQHQPPWPDAHPDLGPDRKPGRLQPAAPYLNPGHRNREVGCAGRGVFGGGVVVKELTDGKPLLGGDFYRASVARRMGVRGQSKNSAQWLKRKAPSA